MGASTAEANSTRMGLSSSLSVAASLSCVGFLLFGATSSGLTNCSPSFLGLRARCDLRTVSAETAACLALACSVVVQEVKPMSEFHLQPIRKNIFGHAPNGEKKNHTERASISGCTLAFRAVEAHSRALPTLYNLHSQSDAFGVIPFSTRVTTHHKTINRISFFFL